MTKQRTSWADHDWHLIPIQPNTPLEHMALDEVLLEEVAAGRRPPTLRFWEWTSSAVILGIFQSVKNEVDVETAKKYGVEIVRRISGGGAMFVEPGNTVTYSIYAPVSLVEGMSFQESYEYMDEFTIRALKDLGIDAWYEPLNDITSANGKIAGAAQARRGGAVLHHVTMAYDIDTDRMMEVLRIGREKMSDKGTKSSGKRVDPLRRQTGLERDVIIQRMTETFGDNYGLKTSSLSQVELAAAKRLIKEKFSTQEWLYRLV